MKTLEKTAVAVAALALMLPGAALAHPGGGQGPHGKPGNPDAVVQPGAPAPSGKAGAPGQVCKSLKIKGKKTPEQRAAFKKCIKDAVAKRQAEHAAMVKAHDDADDADEGDDEGDDDAPKTAVKPSS